MADAVLVALGGMAITFAALAVVLLVMVILSKVARPAKGKDTGGAN